MTAHVYDDKFALKKKLIEIIIIYLFLNFDSMFSQFIYNYDSALDAHNTFAFINININI